MHHLMIMTLPAAIAPDGHPDQEIVNTLVDMRVRSNREGAKIAPAPECRNWLP